MRSDCLVYLSGPISAKNGYSIEENIASALRTYFLLIEKKIPCHCPHLSAAFPSAFGIDYDIWLDLDRRIIDRCTHMFMLERYQTSKGAIIEKEYAMSKGLLVYFNLSDLLKDLEVEHETKET